MEQNNTKTITIGTHHVTMSFSDTPNPDLANLIKSALIDAYLRGHQVVKISQ